MQSWVMIGSAIYRFPVKTGTVKTGNGTLEDDSTVLYKTKSLDDTKPKTNPKTIPNPNPNTNPNPFG